MDRSPDEVDRGLDDLEGRVHRLSAIVYGSPKALMGVRVVCPEDRAALHEIDYARVVACATCHRQYRQLGRIWDLRPSWDARAEAEDAVHLGRGEPTWRRFLDKAVRVRDFERRALAQFVGAETFLEVGGGLSYAAALVKLASPETTVVATDVSPRYLAQHAVPLADFLEAPVDVWVAADVRRLPFADGQFDRVWSAMLIYRLPDPSEAIREIRRVLAPGGRWIGLEPVAPWGWPWSAWEARRMAALNQRRGTQETPRPMRFWRRLAASESLRLRAPPGSRVRWPWARVLVNAVRGVHVWLEFGEMPEETFP